MRRVQRQVSVSVNGILQGPQTWVSFIYSFFVLFHQYLGQTLLICRRRIKEEIYQTVLEQAKAVANGGLKIKWNLERGRLDIEPETWLLDF